jgi:hypothetical protein
MQFSFLRRTVANGRAAIVLVGAVLGVVQFEHPTRRAPLAPFANVARLTAGPSLDAFGASKELKLRFALPGRSIEFPLEVTGDPSTLSYQWVPLRDTTAAEPAQSLDGAEFVAPGRSGFYRLAILRGAERQIIEQPTLAVMVPFEEKIGGMLNGYRIGTYIADKLSGHDHPAGFLEVGANDLDLKVSTHLRLGDFVTHDAQSDVWPKYIALNPRILDKLELVLAKVGTKARVTGAGGELQQLAFDVHSGFRTPAHNAGVWRAARDSRHQYGDAADVAIDADGDGRVTLKDEKVVASAVDEVEGEHPDLVGGLGLYTSHHYRTPYVHIDARGKRSRWKG